MFLAIPALTLSSCNLFGGGSTSDPEYMTPGLIIENGVVTSYEGTDTEVVIPFIHNRYNVTSIGDGAFEFCTSLTSILIPNSVTSIGAGAFSYCTSLTSIIIPDSVTSIGALAFYYCTSLTSINIPNSVTSIGDGAFQFCSSLTSINVDSNNAYYTSIDGILYSNDATTLICCPGGKVGEVIIPNSVTSISDYAFFYCTSITSIIIPNSVTSIGEGAFAGCSSLTSIIIPDSVTSIGAYAFTGCSSLTIYCEAESRPNGWNSDWNPHNFPVIWGA